MSKFDITVLHEDCDPTLANDKKLPYSAYLVEYKKEDRIAYDISIAGSQVLLFDHYYDKYKKILKPLNNQQVLSIQHYGTHQRKQKHPKNQRQNECILSEARP